MDLMFKRGSELILIRILGNKTLQFGKIQGQYLKLSSIEGLKLSISGILSEFPDLEDKSEKEIREEGLKRFIQHVKSMRTNEEVRDYLRKDLGKHGYLLQFYQKNGHRTVKVKNGDI